MAVPFVSGTQKQSSEKFAGAQDTYTVEALMHDGKALQSATSHFFGSGFPEAFGIQYIRQRQSAVRMFTRHHGDCPQEVIGALDHGSR